MTTCRSGRRKGAAQRQYPPRQQALLDCSDRRQRGIVLPRRQTSDVPTHEVVVKQEQGTTSHSACSLRQPALLNCNAQKTMRHLVPRYRHATHPPKQVAVVKGQPQRGAPMTVAMCIHNAFMTAS